MVYLSGASLPRLVCNERPLNGGVCLSDWWVRKGEARPLVKVSVLFSLQPSDTDGWVTEGTSGL